LATSVTHLYLHITFSYCNVTAMCGENIDVHYWLVTVWWTVTHVCAVGFRTLLIEDQMAVLKSSFMELSILRLAFRWGLVRKISVIYTCIMIPLWLVVFLC